MLPKVDKFLQKHPLVVVVTNNESAVIIHTKLNYNMFMYNIYISDGVTPDCACALHRLQWHKQTPTAVLLRPLLHAPLLVTPQLSWGQDNAKSFAGTRTFPGHLGMGESDMCSLREIVGGEGGYRLAAKDIDRSLRISTDSKTPYSDATQVKYSINLDLRHKCLTSLKRHG